MGGYHVFIEGAADPSVEGVKRAAAAIGQRYGMPAEAIAQRMSAGRFRAKSNVELDAAKRFAAEVTRLGAVCSIEDSAGNKVGAAAPTRSVLPPSPASAKQKTGSPLDLATPPPRPAGTKTPPSGYQSGLAAAFGEASSRPDTDLGALVQDNSALSLSSIDGEVEAEKPPAAQGESFAPPDPSEREELFMPPEASKANDMLELAVAAPVRNTPPPMDAMPETVTFEDDAPLTPTPGAPAPLSGAQPVVESVPADSAMVRAKRALARQPRVRLLAGVLLAVLLGFIPTTLFASWREGSVYADSRKEIHNMIADVRSVEDWRGLDERIKGEREVMHSSRRTLAITSMLVWGAAGGGLAFLWFRKFPWERWE